FHAFQRQMSGAWFAFALHPEAITLLEQSLADQKRMAQEEPGGRTGYRQRFEEIQTLLQRLRVLEHNRDTLAARYEQVLLALFIGTVALTVGFLLLRQRRDERRLERLGFALGDLAAGQSDLTLGEKGGDVISRIARMVEETSRRMARDRRRLRSLENLSAWQEAARRHAHEMKTPLTGARLELERLGGLIETTNSGGPARQAVDGVRHELDRLGRFTREFTSFARLPRPNPKALELGGLVGEFVTTFDAAWPELTLRHEVAAEGAADLRVLGDRDMLRQVLVNLCDNSAHALGAAPPKSPSDPQQEGPGGVECAGSAGTVVFRLGVEGDQIWLDVADDGPGVPSELRLHLFEPYTTTRGIGEGMGLGLAICRKILLDHGGDLELRSASRGATFRLTLPAAGTSP
ncbi:MAG: ATP-binding protein, partial [Acidobacteriota bacterium]